MKKKVIFLSVSIFGILLYEGIPFLMNISIPKLPESQIIYDIANIEIGEIVKDGKYRHRNFQNYPEFLKKSVIAIEDRRFYFHDGIDFISLVRAVKNNLFSEKIQGASTIENQLVRNTFWLNEKRTIPLKLKEFLYALSLTSHLSKTEILNLYLNRVSFGYLNYGFESAAKFYYGKSTLSLTQAETIGLITIMKNPQLYNPLSQRTNFEKRFSALTKTLHKRNIITSQEKESILSETLSFSQGTPDTLPYVKDFLKNRSSNTHIFSTIDLHLTQAIDHLAKETILDMAWKNVGDYAILVVERKTMKLKVMIGGENYSAPSGQVNSTLTLRQPGSTLKPFLYALSFKNLQKSASSKILDLPVQFPTTDGNLYAPKNYSLSYAGEVSLAESLSQSLNIPAVKLLNELGENTFLSFLHQLGITSLNKPAEYYGLSLALGSGEVNMFELLRAYGIFANNGKLCDTVYLEGTLTNCKQIIEEKYTTQIYDILSNRYFKLAGFPVNSNLDFEGKEIFVKTGTSRNFKDNWTFGMNDEYLIGVWVGNKDGSEMKGVSGASGAGEIFRKIIFFLDTKDPLSSKVLPIEKTNIPYLEIISPLDGSVFKKNPSIPEQNQEIQLSFASNIPYTRFEWYLDEKKIENNFLALKNISGSQKLLLKLFFDSKTVAEKEIFISTPQK